jgi:putative heme degradation protein
MKTGKKLSPEQLQMWAANLVQESGVPKRKLAQTLEVSPGALTRATSEQGAKWFRLQTRIVEILSEFTVAARTELVVRRKKD